MGFLEFSLHSQHCHNGICSRKIPSSLRESVALNVGLISSAKEGKSGFIYNLVKINKLFEPRKRACIS